MRHRTLLQNFSTGTLVVLSGVIATSLPAFAQTVCVPTLLNVVINAPTQGFNPATSAGVPLDVNVTDDCKAAVNSATVVASFSDNEPKVTLQSAGNGKYTGTWTSASATANSVVLTINASLAVTQNSPFGTINVTNVGSAKLTGSVAADTTQPLVFDGGVVGAAAPGDGSNAAPGSFISIYGRNLSDATVQAPSLPLATALNNVSVNIDGTPIPLLFVSAGQINAIVPYDVSTDATHNVTVTRNGKTSAATTLKVNPAQPGMFTINQAGTGQAIVVNGTTNIIADKSNPVKAGDVIVIYASGLGATNPAVKAGDAVGTTALSPTVYPVYVRIAGFSAPVLFAGLTPGFAELYQINALVPAGVPIGDAIPITVSSATGGIIDRTSPEASLAIKQ